MFNSSDIQVADSLSETIAFTVRSFTTVSNFPSPAACRLFWRPNPGRRLPVGNHCTHSKKFFYRIELSESGSLSDVLAAESRSPPENYLLTQCALQPAHAPHGASGSRDLCYRACLRSLLVTAMSLLDQVMGSHGTAEWTYTSLGEPHLHVVRSAVEGAITMQEFVSGVLCEPGAMRRTRIMVDMQENVPEIGHLQSFLVGIRAGRLDQLPEGVRPRAALPPHTKIGLAVDNKKDGTMDVLKIYYFDGPNAVAVKTATDLATGTAYLAQYRGGRGPSRRLSRRYWTTSLGSTPGGTPSLRLHSRGATHPGDLFRTRNCEQV